MSLVHFDRPYTIHGVRSIHVHLASLSQSLRKQASDGSSCSTNVLCESALSPALAGDDAAEATVLGIALPVIGAISLLSIGGVFFLVARRDRSIVHETGHSNAVTEGVLCGGQENELDNQSRYLESESVPADF
jgi:hypothetical protein